jgi:hypothetical protein
VSPTATSSPSVTTIWNTVDTISARTSSAIGHPLVHGRFRLWFRHP